MAGSSSLSCRAVACCMFVVAAIMVAAAVAQNSAQDFVDPHNAARAEVGVGPVRWDDTAAAYARGYAAQRRGDCKLHTDSGGRYGENIFWGSAGGDWTAASAVAAWVKEKQWYDRGSNSCSAPPGRPCGHYTQVVWRGSTAIGCARVVCDNNLGVFITFNYSPPGNYNGKPPY
ncbi:pathogenesis-related protein PRB1-3-like [Oryza glaberrima]|uniref:pathogenesis-related protein PRB1-3-like n=1 Tax=Oryza glaberrima TaxID=4538 RepID=UPI00224C31B0|nr:pathogenesis-related protein PRB1-3-like [Oryza glaberrima]